MSDIKKVPAFVDMHCHLREPGFEQKETIETGCASALAGGFGIICPMANTNPVNDNLETLKYVLDKSKNTGVDVRPICAITKGLQGKELTDMKALKDAGAIAFSDDGRPVEDMKMLYDAMMMAKELGVLLISHAEDGSIRDTHKFSEDVATARELEVLRNVPGCRYHFAHVSTKRSLDLIRQAKKEIPTLTCETAPHYFVPNLKVDKSDARFKVNPPLRDAQDIEAVIEALKDGTIDVIATDHAPHTIEEKNLPWAQAPMGIAGFETAFALGNTYLVKPGYLTLDELVEKMSTNPAKILGVEVNSFTLIDENLEWTVRAADFKTKCKLSPFEGLRLTGKCIEVI